MVISPYERSFTALIRSAFPKKTPAEKVQSYAKAFFPTIESLFKKEETDFILFLDNEPLSASKAYIWTHKESNGIHLIYVPDFAGARKREDGTLEIVVTTVFISRVNPSSFQVKKAIALDYTSNKKTIAFNQEMQNRKVALSLPGGVQYFTPLALTGDGFSVKCQEHERLTDSLSIWDFLQVLDGVFGGLKVLEDAGYASFDISPDNISVKRGLEGKIEGKIDHFVSLTRVGAKISQRTNRRQNVFTQNGYACPETDRYALVLLIAERVFLNLDGHLDWSLDGFEKHALKRIENFVCDIHYQEVLQLKLQHGGFQGGFCQDLLNYVEGIRRQGEENFQCVILDQFAYNMTLFPEAVDLLTRAMQADLKIPTLEEIYQTLQLGKVKLDSLQVDKEHTQVSLISISTAEKIAYKVLPESRYHEAHACIEAFWKILNECLDYFPSVGSEVRIHQDVLYGDKGAVSPFSFWLRVERDQLILEIFDPRVAQPLGIGSYKKVKACLQVVIHAGGTLTFTPIAISRLRDVGSWDDKMARSNSLLERLMHEPGAVEYFIPPLTKHAPHEVGHTRKLEAVSIRFETTLHQTIKNHVIKTEKGNYYLSKLEELSFLGNVGEGIKRIAASGLSHQDIKSGNVALTLKEGRLIARIFDFDLISSFETFTFADDFYVWNILRYKYGYVSKETDLYGYVLLLAATLLSGFSPCEENETSKAATLRIQGLARNSKSEKDALKRQSKEQILNKYPHAFGRDMKAFLSKFSETAKVSDVPDSFFYYIQTLPKEAQIVALHLKHFITEWLIFDLVFDLLIKTVQADLASQVKIEEKLKNMGIYSQVESAASSYKVEFLDEHPKELLKKAARGSLNEAGLPSLEEIEKVLALCKTIAEEVESRSVRPKDSYWCVVS